MAYQFELRKWDKDLGAVGAILIGENGELLAGADPREETTLMGV